jgi:RNA-directed DNA polymerase
MRENREARRPPARLVDRWAGRLGKASGRTPRLNDRRESDSCVGPAKLANTAGSPAAEPVERRRLEEGNTDQQNALRTQGREARASSALERVRHVARKDREARFTALLHQVSVDRLRLA